MPYRNDGTGVGKWTGYNLWACSGCGDYIDGEQNEWESGETEKLDKLRGYIDDHYSECQPYRASQGLDRPSPAE